MFQFFHAVNFFALCIKKCRFGRKGRSVLYPNPQKRLSKSLGKRKPNLLRKRGAAVAAALLLLRLLRQRLLRQRLLLLLLRQRLLLLLLRQGQEQAEEQRQQEEQAEEQRQQEEQAEEQSPLHWPVCWGWQSP